MRKYLGLLAVAFALASARPASAWCDGCFGFGIGFSVSCGGCGPSCGYGCGPSCGYGSCGFGFGCGFGCGPCCGPTCGAYCGPPCAPGCGPCIGPWNPPCGYAPAMSPCCVPPYYPPTCCLPPCAPRCGYGGYARYAPPPPNPYAEGPPWVDPVNQYYGCTGPNPWAPMPQYWGWQTTPVNFIRD
jgi:hypothetical protein